MPDIFLDFQTILETKTFFSRAMSDIRPIFQLLLLSQRLLFISSNLVVFGLACLCVQGVCKKAFFTFFNLKTPKSLIPNYELHTISVITPVVKKIRTSSAITTTRNWRTGIM